MATQCAYAVVRVHADRYRLDRVTSSVTGAAAFVTRVTDRFDKPIGWRLKPLLVMQGATSRVWASVADALAATKLMTPGQARAAVTAADAADPAHARAAP